MKAYLKNITGYVWFLSLLLLARWQKRTTFGTWPQKQWILGHRGARNHAPENTISSFKKAVQYGADGVEFDVTLSKDGIPVVIHDDTLDRTTNSHGLVFDRTALELAKLDATKLCPGPTQEGVPTLKETLASLPKGFIANIELKSAGRHPKALLVDRVITTAEPYAQNLVLIFSSFDGEILSLFRNRAPHHIVSLLLCPNDKQWPTSLTYWHHIKPDGLHIPPTLATRSVIWLAKGASLPIAVWTVNDPNLVRSYFAKGISGIFTDEVPKIVAAIRQ